MVQKYRVRDPQGRWLPDVYELGPVRLLAIRSAGFFVMEVEMDNASKRS